MGLNPFWQEDVFLTVQAFQHDIKWLHPAPFCILQCNGQFFIHLVSLTNQFEPKELIALQFQYQQEGKQLVHLWEDVWLARRAQVLMRVRSFLGLNQIYHGRQSQIVEIDSKTAQRFLDMHHLQGYIHAKYHYGLTYHDELLAVASFSSARPMKSKGVAYQSAELVRFASANGLTIAGGLSKLIRHFTKQLKLNDLMTYADRDWSLGKGYDKLGFSYANETEPAYLYVNSSTLVRYFPHRLPAKIVLDFEAQKDLNLDDFLAFNGYIKLFNTGNLKYYLYF